MDLQRNSFNLHLPPFPPNPTPTPLLFQLHWPEPGWGGRERRAHLAQAVPAFLPAPATGGVFGQLSTRLKGIPRRSRASERPRQPRPALKSTDDSPSGVRELQETDRAGTGTGTGSAATHARPCPPPSSPAPSCNRGPAHGFRRRPRSVIHPYPGRVLTTGSTLPSRSYGTSPHRLSQGPNSLAFVEYLQTLKGWRKKEGESEGKSHGLLVLRPGVSLSVSGLTGASQKVTIATHLCLLGHSHALFYFTLVFLSLGHLCHLLQHSQGCDVREA